jgi:tripartite ATP-independent transporter DctP family solute receptor
MKLLSALLSVTVLLFTGCGKSSSENGKVVLRLAHTQTPDSQVAQIVEKFANSVDGSNTNLDLEVYTSGVLGSERDTIELVKAGVLDMAKVGASSLDQFNKNYSIFSLPYVFQSTEHYYNALENSKGVKEIMVSGEKDGYIALGFYASGARNVYTTKSEAATDPSKLKGLKIRVMESPTAKRMVGLMGGSPVPMAVGEVYTALQQGLLDGGENTEMALTVNKHGEVAKTYTYTEHQYTPDVFIISTKVWDKLNDKQKEAIKNAMHENSEEYKASYTSMINDAVKQAEKMGVNFKRIDKKPFIQAVQPMHEDYKAKGPKFAEYYDDIQKYIPESEKIQK